MRDNAETTTERHLEEARQRGRAEMRDEILEYITAMGGGYGAARNMQLQLLVIKLESME